MPTRPSRYLLLFAVFSLALGTVCAADKHKNATTTEYDSVSASSTALPAIVQPRFLGLYGADGSYKSLDANSKSLIGPLESVEELRFRSAAVPRFVNRRTSETVVEDLAPPARPRRSMKGKSGFFRLRDSIINAIYGPEQVLLSPTLVATDSHQRLIIADPLEPAIHVLDGAHSFRIQGGTAHRLLRPSGIALDSNDNIYVADGKLAQVLVYNSDGQFLRTIGDFRGESMFQGPTAIAIDHSTNLLYVLDSPLNEIVVLDLTGRVVKRIGGIHSRNTDVKLDLPTAIAVADNSIVVLDTQYSRIVVLDLNGRLRGEFAIRPVHVPALVRNVGIALDSKGNIYTSYPEASTCRIYKQNGELIGGLRETRFPNAHLTAPAGIWVDSSDHVFVADPNRSSVQVFQSTGIEVAEQPSAPLEIDH